MAIGSWTAKGKLPTVFMSDGIASHLEANVAGISIRKVISCAGK